MKTLERNALKSLIGGVVQGGGAKKCCVHWTNPNYTGMTNPYFPAELWDCSFASQSSAQTTADALAYSLQQAGINSSVHYCCSCSNIPSNMT